MEGCDRDAADGATAVYTSVIDNEGAVVPSLQLTHMKPSHRLVIVADFPKIRVQSTWGNELRSHVSRPSSVPHGEGSQGRLVFRLADYPALVRHLPGE
jgi:hypothetical protein